MCLNAWASFVHPHHIHFPLVYGFSSFFIYSYYCSCCDYFFFFFSFILLILFRHSMARVMSLCARNLTFCFVCILFELVLCALLDTHTHIAFPSLSLFLSFFYNYEMKIPWLRKSGHGNSEVCTVVFTCICTVSVLNHFA